jgi:hypothetical protein
VYSTCLFCNQSLGANEVVEAFPVGRRLAFDQRRGRLWVVCRKCEKWNLTPLEERWEAIERCERLFRDTRKRVSTDNIGLARLSDGLELVRIGDPLRPEFAAWRYGDQFGRRRKRNIVVAGSLFAITVGALSVNTLVVAGSVAAMAGMTAQGGFSWYWGIHAIRRMKRPYARIPAGNAYLILRGRDTARLVPDLVSPEGWSVDLSHHNGHTRLAHDSALRAIRAIVPRLNVGGGSSRQVQSAVRRLERSPDLNVMLKSLANDPALQKATRWRRNLPDGVHFLPVETRLALEMALNEESEHRALEGELAVLELAWKEAEEIAAIADDLVLPAALDEQLHDLKAEVHSRARTHRNAEEAV